MSRPYLIEPGTKYFLSATLKNSNIKRIKQNKFYFNVSLFVLFSIIIAVFLMYKFKNKASKEEIQARKRQKEIYILSKVRNVIEHKEKQHTNIITNLPKFQSDYKLLHEKYYKL
mgnify:CR=1 FL=1|tara:strand:+ start:1657 stop:1998 length:342 start_codon:yes stop_codon:yes gene_type:complete